jgi:Ca2+-binding EF-hand superfamily protein
MIDVEELFKAFKELGVEVDKKEATKLLQRYVLDLDTFHSLPSLFSVGVDQVHLL